MKRLFLPLLLITAMLMAACGGSAPAAAPAADAGASEAPAATTSERCGDPNRLDKDLNVYNWTDYMDPEIVSQFEDECGVKVVYDTFSSNEDLLAKLQA
ncbi:MAG: hypothetical protein KDE20_29435, partial [Caldilineaceae bacterium]|nr:hypothetical protein [Caldilineaceae bacterium]